MKFKADGFNWIVRLERGELLIESLDKIVRQEDIGGAWISGLGGAEWAELGYYDLEKQEYQWKKLDQLLEITSLQGNVSWLDGEPKLHVHGSFSDQNMRAFGGHVKELQVGGTCEILFHKWYKDHLTRSADDSVGLPLLDL